MNPALYADRFAVLLLLRCVDGLVHSIHPARRLTVKKAEEHGYPLGFKYLIYVAIRVLPLYFIYFSIAVILRIGSTSEIWLYNPSHLFCSVLLPNAPLACVSSSREDLIQERKKVNLQATNVLRGVRSDGTHLFDSWTISKSP